VRGVGDLTIPKNEFILFFESLLLKIPNNKKIYINYL
jgi:hypothetical protein